MCTKTLEPAGRANRLYVFFAVETDGPVPALNSMVAFGLSAVDVFGTEHAFLYRSVLPLAGHVPDPQTVAEHWERFPATWSDTQAKAVEPREFVREVEALLGQLQARWQLRFVAKPAAEAWQWLVNYYHLFRSRHAPDLGPAPAICLNTLLEAQSSRSAAEVASSASQPLSPTHRVLDGARHHARVFLRVCDALRVSF